MIQEFAYKQCEKPLAIRWEGLFLLFVLRKLVFSGFSMNYFCWLVVAGFSMNYFCWLVVALCCFVVFSGENGVHFPRLEKKETGGGGLAMNGLQESADSPPAPAVPKVGDHGKPS